MLTETSPDPSVGLKDLLDSLTDVGNLLTDALNINLGYRAFRDPVYLRTACRRIL